MPIWECWKWLSIEQLKTKAADVGRDMQPALSALDQANASVAPIIRQASNMSTVAIVITRINMPPPAERDAPKIGFDRF